MIVCNLVHVPAVDIAGGWNGRVLLPDLSILAFTVWKPGKFGGIVPTGFKAMDHPMQGFAGSSL